MSFRRLQREWYAKAAASGFVDLEGPTGDGALSDRGNLHPVAETGAEWQRLGQRVSDGEDYTAWADGVLHNFRFASREERDIWRLHAEGYGEREIATALTINRNTVHARIVSVKERVGKDGKARRWRNEKKQRRSQVRALVARCDPRILGKLVAVMMRQQARSSPSGS